MKNDISNPEFVKKRTQNIKYMLLNELGYEGDELKIDITPYIFKGSVEEINFDFYLSVYLFVSYVERERFQIGRLQQP
jgi:hypothetical protein